MFLMLVAHSVNELVIDYMLNILIFLKQLKYYKMDLLAEIEIDIATIGIIYPSRFSYTELAEFYTQLSKLQTLAARCGIEKINDHYNICPWSNKNCLCGPDTCSCISANFTFHDLKKKMLFIKQRLLVK